MTIGCSFGLHRFVVMLFVVVSLLVGAIPEREHGAEARPRP